MLTFTLDNITLSIVTHEQAVTNVNANGIVTYTPYSIFEKTAGKKAAPKNKASVNASPKPTPKAGLR